MSSPVTLPTAPTNPQSWRYDLICQHHYVGSREPDVCSGWTALTVDDLHYDPSDGHVKATCNHCQAPVILTNVPASIVAAVRERVSSSSPGGVITVRVMTQAELSGKIVPRSN